MIAAKQKEFIRLMNRTKRQFDPINFFTNTKFKYIFAFWLVVIVLFGLGYFGLSFTDSHSLLQDKIPLTKDMGGMFNAMYFSVISATATGYGDIVPRGFSKLLAILEVILGLTIFGMLISKLVSYKQEVILEEIYEISFDEKINRLRSALYLFRADVTRMMDKIETTGLSKRKLQDVWVLLTSFANTMGDVEKILCPKKKKEFIKKIDELNLELVLNSIDLSLVRVNELLSIMDSQELDWKTDKINHMINRIKNISNNIYEYYHKSKKLSSKALEKIKDISTDIQQMEKAVDGLSI